VDAGSCKENASKQVLVPAFRKFMFDQSDKLGVILASISLIDVVANCRHGAGLIVL
jgi:hypothetical protein